MGGAEVFKEMIPLSSEDCFLIKQRTKTGFNFPLHVHREFELNYLENANGALRIVGDSIELMEDLDLMLVAGGLRHTYLNHMCSSEHISQITVQFQVSLFDSLLEKRHFKSIKEMFENAVGGLVFSRETILAVQDQLRNISNDNNPESFTNLLRLLDVFKSLSLDKSARCLNNIPATFNKNTIVQDTDRLDQVMAYLRGNYQRHISLSELADYVNMSEASLIRFFKKWTGKTFVENLNEIRVREAVCRLVDTSDSVSEICYKCGFNNLSNFNRVFKRLQGTTPSNYREKFSRTKFKL